MGAGKAVLDGTTRLDPAGGRPTRLTLHGEALEAVRDRLLDMCRTAVNVTGDLVACVTVDRAVATGRKLRRRQR